MPAISLEAAYIRPVYEEKDDISAPVVNITSGTTVGFRYLQFGNTSAKKVTIILEEAKPVKINVRLDSYNGRVISTVVFDGSENEKTSEITCGVIGKHAIYFEFVSEDTEREYTFDRFTFD